MFCTKCGNQIKDGFKFCPKCGTPAYVEKEGSKNEVKNEEIDEVSKEEKTESTDEVVLAAEIKETNNTKAGTKSKTKDSDLSPHNNFIPNPLIEIELDIEGVKKRAEKGDKEAMLRQAFRYEIGIGCEMNKEKAASLYEQVKGYKELFPIEELRYKSIIGLDELK